jgi:5-methylcytosine-specific restriction protein A
MRPKLTTLKPKLQALNSRIAQPLTTATQRKRGSAGVKDRNRIRERDCGLCQICAADGRTRLGDVVDHKQPLWAGGSDEDENKWLLCHECHDVKTKREAAERGQ